MGKLLAETVPLALAAAVSPVLFLVQLATLTGERRLVRGAAVAAGAMVPLLLVGAFAVFLGQSSSFAPSPTTKAVIDLFLGLVLFFGIGLRALRQSPEERPREHRRRASGPGGSFLLGLAGMSSNVTTFAFFIPAMRFVALSPVSHPDQVAVAILILLITMTTVLFPLALTVLAPSTSGRVLDAIGGWLSGHSRRNQIALGFALGGWLIVRGVSGL